MPASNPVAVHVRFPNVDSVEEHKADTATPPRGVCCTDQEANEQLAAEQAVSAVHETTAEAVTSAELGNTVTFVGTDAKAAVAREDDAALATLEPATHEHPFCAVKLYVTPAARPVAEQEGEEKTDVPLQVVAVPLTLPATNCSTVQLVKEQPVPEHAEGAVHSTTREVKGAEGFAETDRDVGTDPGVAVT